jgi:hypothetical protein
VYRQQVIEDPGGVEAERFDQRPGFRQLGPRPVLLGRHHADP